MAYEIDYLPVGEEEKSGDAIALRYGNLTGRREEQVVIVIDGGYKESGEQLVKHVNDFFDTKRIDLAISTHPDLDHASGLCVVLDKMEVGGLMMHRPWEHAATIQSFFKDRRLTTSGLEEKIEKSLQQASDLESIALSKSVPIFEPFEGLTLGNVIHVLGPSLQYYQEMLACFEQLPEIKRGLGILAPIQKVATEAVRWVEDKIGLDLLNDDDDTTSPQNNTSTILLFTIDGRKILFTGDAGRTALLNAIAYAERAGISLNDLEFLDVPHHGSKRNLNSKILQKIKGQTAFVSAPKGSSKHPAKKVTNALQKHGMSVYVTRGSNLLHHHQGNGRGWGNATKEPFHTYVEE